MKTAVFEPEAYHFRPLTSPNTLFLDRDGVLNLAVLRGEEISSPRTLDEFRLAEDIDALAQPGLASDWNLVVVTNQPDLARGRITRELVAEFHARIGARIALNAVYLCPHQGADACACRKPATGLIESFRGRHPGLSGRSMMVGDRANDLFCARAAGIPFILLRRSYNEDLVIQCQKVVNSLWELKAQLLNRP